MTDRWIESRTLGSLVQVVEDRGQYPVVHVRAGYADGTYDAPEDAYEIDWDRAFTTPEEAADTARRIRNLWERSSMIGGTGAPRAI